MSYINVLREELKLSEEDLKDGDLFEGSCILNDGGELENFIRQLIYTRSGSSYWMEFGRDLKIQRELHDYVMSCLKSKYARIRPNFI